MADGEVHRVEVRLLANCLPAFLACSHGDLEPGHLALALGQDGGLGRRAEHEASIIPLLDASSAAGMISADASLEEGALLISPDAVHLQDRELVTSIPLAQ